MKKAIWITISILLLIPLVFVGTVYGYIRYQYQDTFMPGLFINGLYAADYTPEDLNARLMQDTECPDFTVRDKEGKTYQFSLEEIQYKQDYLARIKEIQKSQSVFQYVKWFTAEDVKFEEMTIEPERSFETDTLHAYLDQVKYLEDNSDPNGKTVEIRRDGNGYYLYDETRNLLSHEKASAAIEDALKNGVFEIDLYDAGCYIEVEHTKQMEKSLELWDMLAYYVESEITYEFGNRTELIDREEISSFIAVDENGEFLFDENGSFYLDEQKVKEYVPENEARQYAEAAYELYSEGRGLTEYEAVEKIVDQYGLETE